MFEQSEQSLLVLVLAQVQCEDRTAFVVETASGPIDAPTIDAIGAHMLGQARTATEDLQCERRVARDLEAILHECPWSLFLWVDF